MEKHDQSDAEKRRTFTDAAAELHVVAKAYGSDGADLLTALDVFRNQYAAAQPETNDQQHDARRAFDPVADAIRGLVKQVDLLCKLAARAADLGTDLGGNNVNRELAAAYDRRAIGRLVKQLEEQRKAAVEQLKHVAYLHRQVVWLQDRFPNAELKAVPGLVRLVDRAKIEAADWSLTSGRYVGVAPQEEDEEFDFEQAMRDTHAEVTELNQKAAILAARIQESFEELGI